MDRNEFEASDPGWKKTPKRSNILSHTSFNGEIQHLLKSSRTQGGVTQIGWFPWLEKNCQCFGCLFSCF